MDSSPTQRRAPASAKSEQRVRDILRVSRDVFSERGYEKATTIEIAQRLGISEATVFTYFRGKRELCMRVISDWYDEIIATITTGLPRELSIKAQFEFIVATHLRLFAVQGTGLCALVLSEGRIKGQELGDALVALQRRYTAPMMELLRRGQACGEIRRDVPLRLLRSMVFGPMEHILWDVVMTHRELDDMERTARDCVAVLWTALQPPQPEVAALRELHGSVAAALRRFDAASTPPRPETEQDSISG